MLLVLNLSEKLVCVRNELISFRTNDPKKPTATLPCYKGYDVPRSRSAIWVTLVYINPIAEQKTYFFPSVWPLVVQDASISLIVFIHYFLLIVGILCFLLQLSCTDEEKYIAFQTPHSFGTAVCSILNLWLIALWYFFWRSKSFIFELWVTIVVLFISVVF